MAREFKMRRNILKRLKAEGYEDYEILELSSSILAAQQGKLSFIYLNTKKNEEILTLRKN
jgi:hypothetical protein